LTGTLENFLFPFHLGVLLIGFACFGFASLAALVYLIQKHELKSKHLGKLFLLLPSLETLDRLAVRSLIIGTVCLTAGVATGLYLAHLVWPRDWTKDPKVLFSFATWLWFLLLLGVRYKAGWRGRKFFVLIFIGFLFLVLTFLVSLWRWM